MDLGALMEVAATHRVTRADHAILVAPQHERRYVAQLTQTIPDRERGLLAARRDDHQHPAPQRRLIGPHDRARGQRALARLVPVADQHADERVVLTTQAADEEASNESALPGAPWIEQRAADERQAIELVDPMQRATECRGCDQHEAVYELGSAEREVQRHATAERVADDHSALDAKLIDHM